MRDHEGRHGRCLSAEDRAACREVGEPDYAVASGLSCLRLFGIDLPPHPTWDQVQREYDEIWPI